MLAAAREQTARLGLPLPGRFASGDLGTDGADRWRSALRCVNFATSERAIYFARPLPLASPTTRVLAVAEVPVSIVTTILAQAIEIPGLVVTLERDNGQLLASVPAASRSSAQSLATPLPAEALDGRPTRAAGPARRRPSIVAARPLAVPVGADLGGHSARRRAGRLAPGPQHHRRRGRALHRHDHRRRRLRRIGRSAGWRARGSRLARAKDNMDRALASMADGFLLCDAEDRVVAWNARYLEMFPWLDRVIGVGVQFERWSTPRRARSLPDDPAAQREAWRRDARWALHRSGDGMFEQELTGWQRHPRDRAPDARRRRRQRDARHHRWPSAS